MTAHSATGVKLNLRSPQLFWPGLLLLIAGALWLRAQLLLSFPLQADEGIHLIWLRLLAAGYQPYSEVYVTYPPLYPLAIEAVWRLWPGEAAQRWFSVAYAVFGIVGVALLARRLAGTTTGLVAAALLLFSPALFEESRAVMGEFPSVAWSVWAVWLSWRYLEGPAERRGWGWLVGGAICFAFSLLTKFLSPFLLAFFPLLILARWWTRRNWSLAAYKPVLTDLLIWGAAFGLTLLLVVFLFDVPAFFAQVVGQRLEARTVYIEDGDYWPVRLELSREFLRADLPLVLLGLAGITLAGRQRLRQGWLVLLWLGLALVMLLIHSPLRFKHFLILLPPLAIYSGVALSWWLAAVQQWLAGRPTAWRVAGPGLAVLALLYAWHIPAAWSLWQAQAAVPQPPGVEAEALAFIQEVTAPDDCLITDDMPLLYWSGRMTPPELAEVSSNRLKSGVLTAEALAVLTDRDDCQLIAAVSNRITKYTPRYMEWVKTKYLGRFHYGEDDLYFAKADTEPNPSRPLAATFADQFRFHGYDLTEQAVSPGERVPLRLYWQAQAQPNRDYTVFVQLRDAQNQVVASADHQPYLGLIPTSTWPAGAAVPEVSWLTVPAGLPPGAYHLYVGWYNPENLERLPLTPDSSGENALILGPLQVR